MIKRVLLAPVWFLLAGAAWLITKIPERWFMP